ncbi:MAG: 2-oxoacid:acceptor oxidoreductase subunit alpha [candidate division FCPU426 bacterium]
MKSKTFDYVITIGGEAGQGMQTLGVLLAKVFLKLGYFMSTLQSYQSRIRGGHNFFQLRISSRPIHSLRRGTDLLVALDQNTIETHCRNLNRQSVAIFDLARIKPKPGCGQMLGLEIERIFPGAKENEIFANIVYLGALMALLGCPSDPVEKLLAATFGKKGEDVIVKNRAAFRAGLEYILGQSAWKNRYQAPAPLNPQSSLLVHGNQAIALGAAAAGCGFYSAYPMTPSTSVFETMAGLAAKANIIVEQAEDEIAAMNMVLGASYAGTRAMTGTSGGGFALMVEALSLAGMLECPAVIVNAQRPGPATGLPTRTEQADLGFVIHAGHGEFPRVVLAPGNQEECFWLTVHAFNLADRYQIPVIILTDQYLADLYGNVKPFQTEKVKIERGLVVEAGESYVRYRLTPDGVSPRAFPGKGPGVVIADSDEHTEDGHLTEDLNVRIKMNAKRLAKLKSLQRELLRPTVQGIHKDNLVLCWGSSLGPCQDAVNQLADEGSKVSLMHFSQLWPLEGSKLRSWLAPYRRLICVEGNAGGQFARILRAETEITIHAKILRTDGKPFLQDELAAQIKKHLRPVASGRKKRMIRRKK